MAASDSLIGEGLNPSPYSEVMAENEKLRAQVKDLTELLVYTSSPVGIFNDDQRNSCRSLMLHIEYLIRWMNFVELDKVVASFDVDNESVLRTITMIRTPYRCRGELPHWPDLLRKARKKYADQPSLFRGLPNEQG